MSLLVTESAVQITAAVDIVVVSIASTFHVVAFVAFLTLSTAVVVATIANVVAAVVVVTFS